MGRRSTVGMWRCVLLASVLACGSACPGTSRAQAQDDPLAAVRAPVSRALDTLARKGHSEDLSTLHGVLLACGEPAESADKALASARVKFERARKQNDRVQDAVRLLEKARDAGVTALATIEGSRRPAIADALLSLDGECEAAWRALGCERHPQGWLPADLVPLFERRAAIQDALTEVRRLDVPLEESESNDFLIQALYGGGVKVRHRSIELHAHGVPVVKLRRMLREVVRAVALSRFVMGHARVELPDRLPTAKVLLLDTTPDYTRALDALTERKRLSPKERERAERVRSTWIPPDRRVVKPTPEARIEAVVFDDLWNQVAEWDAVKLNLQPALQAGHVNWICQSYLGTSIPSFTYIETEKEGGRTFDHPPEVLEMMRLAEAGIRGARAWMEYLASREEDPAWSRSFVDQVGKIAGDDLTKSTFVAEYLQERGDFLDVLKATAVKHYDAKTFSAALGTMLPDFETAWRRWLLAPQARLGVLQRLGGGNSTAPELPSEIRTLLDYLDGIRAPCVDENVQADMRPLGFDPSLSLGCEAHARYLAKNPEQAAAWPDAHEEWPDRELYSPAGSWAGLNSVIAPGSSDGKDAVDGWLATFYHRLPLLEPGLVRIGWGLHDGYAVLDSGSMVGRFPYVTSVRFPAPGATGVPLGFAPELPHPVPGEDQSAWGYPVTLQYIGETEVLDSVAMRLFRGAAGGEAVDCHFSSPLAPTNPELSPHNAWCLIPKARLRPSTTYTVVCTGLPDDETVTWSFTTGR